MGQLDGPRCEATEYVDTGISGSRDRRPALDARMAAAQRREPAAVVGVRLDRLARLGDEPHAQTVARGRSARALRGRPPIEPAAWGRRRIGIVSAAITT